MPERLHLSVMLARDSADAEYFISCARRRDVAVTTLMRRLIEVITKDQLITAILDDDSKWERQIGDHKYRDQHH